PSGDQVTYDRGSSGSAEMSGWAPSPFTRINQISRRLPVKIRYASCEASGENAPCVASSASFRISPVNVDITHNSRSSVGPVGPAGTILVPSGAQPGRGHVKHKPLGAGIDRVSPVAIRRTWMPFVSA